MNIPKMTEERPERSDGKIVKMEVDYSSTVDQRLPECEKMAKVSLKEATAGWVMVHQYHCGSIQANIDFFVTKCKFL